VCAARRLREPPRKARGSGGAGIPRVGPRRMNRGKFPGHGRAPLNDNP
jgi:hypothetical protein